MVRITCSTEADLRIIDVNQENRILDRQLTYSTSWSSSGIALQKFHDLIGTLGVQTRSGLIEKEIFGFRQGFEGAYVLLKAAFVN